MVMPPAALSLAALPPGVIWPLLLGALASAVACAAAAGAVVAQRHASQRRRGPSSTSRP
jgi:hypothetical protein